ncbi:hypothetical protein [Pseudonocardia sp. MH-G8]|uniref:hypothetical protein n=1 Tax=Pseudonocardia sp. MH-G8 TaxID=1854588 RepID=UPI000BA062F7|nr:hypothetical protein [Pseudonocardia sp. MH-G8]OZM77167.1 hypothetical protein CFP66_36650 [Pseudonocardia sp. MH-G8]
MSAQRLRHRTMPVSSADQRVAEAMSADQEPWPDAHDLPSDGPEEETAPRAAAHMISIPLTWTEDVLPVAAVGAGLR